MTALRMMRRMDEIVDVAEELAGRFPDLSDDDVRDHVEYVTRYALNRTERREMLDAYERRACLMAGFARYAEVAH
jgi:hypothetical protein